MIKDMSVLEKTNGTRTSFDALSKAIRGAVDEQRLEQCRSAIAADEEIKALVKQLARRKDKGEYSKDREPLAKAMSKHYKKGRSWRDWLVAAQVMIEEHRSLLVETPTPPPDADVAMREAIRSYVFSETDPEKHDVIRRLYEQWEEWNEEFFEGRMTIPIILLNEPSNPRRLGDCGPVSGFGCSSQIRIRPSLLRGTLTEGRWRYGADVLLHEMIHQWQFEVHGNLDRSYPWHGPTFSSKANEIAQKLGLPEVGRTCKKRDHEDVGVPAPQDWPAPVRPADYYGFPAKSCCVSTSEDEQPAKRFLVPADDADQALDLMLQHYDAEELLVRLGVHTSKDGQ